MHFFALHLY